MARNLPRGHQHGVLSAKEAEPPATDAFNGSQRFEDARAEILSLRKRVGDLEKTLGNIKTALIVVSVIVTAIAVPIGLAVFNWASGTLN